MIDERELHQAHQEIAALRAELERRHTIPPYTQRVDALCAEYERHRANKSFLARKYGIGRTTVWRVLRRRGLA
jgi:transcriptional regulator of acetoin/glycerol metabolism